MDSQDRCQWYYKPLVVITALFVVLGPLGLPLLFRSPHFSKTLKIILAIVTVVYTVYLIYVSIELLRMIMKMFADIQNLQS